jgi:hypothetical protein
MKKSTLVLIMLLASSFSQAGQVLTCSTYINSVNNQIFIPIMGHSSESGIRAWIEGKSLKISMAREIKSSNRIEHIFGLDAIKDTTKIGTAFNLKFTVVFERTANGVTTQFTIKDLPTPSSGNVSTQIYSIYSKDDKPFTWWVNSPSGARFNMLCKTE